MFGPTIKKDVFTLTNKALNCCHEIIHCFSARVKWKAYYGIHKGRIGFVYRAIDRYRKIYWNILVAFNEPLYILQALLE
jgi:hypothetical protein